MSNEEKVKFLEKVVFTLHNKPLDKIIKRVYGNGHISWYLEEKQQAIRDNPLSWYAELDTEHRELFVEYVTECYGI